MSNSVVSDEEREPGDPSADGSLVPVLLSFAKTTRQLLGIKLAGLGVVTGQDQFLAAFGPDPLRSVGELADAMSVRPSTVSKMADILVEKGWVRREADEADKRRSFVRLTSNGERVAAEVRRVWAELERELRTSLDGTGGAVVDSMGQLETALAKRLSRLR